MIIDGNGIVAASKMELLAIWLYDNDLFRLFHYGEFVIRCRIQGVKVNA